MTSFEAKLLLDPTLVGLQTALNYHNNMLKEASNNFMCLEIGSKEWITAHKDFLDCKMSIHRVLDKMENIYTLCKNHEEYTLEEAEKIISMMYWFT